jgi:hypothetical protein
MLNMAMLINMAKIRWDTIAANGAGRSAKGDLAASFLAAARAAGWSVLATSQIGLRRPDAHIRKGKRRYLVALKASSEGRRDRLVPLLSQAILEARSLAVPDPHRARPLAVVAAPQVSEPVVKAVREFAHEHAPDVAIGLLDREGRRVFVGPGLESLNADPSEASVHPLAAGEPSIELFSDLNQWMLKVLLAPHLGHPDLMPESLPRGEYRNASELARVAQVSVMSAFRFVRQLEREGFLHESREQLRLVRLDALLQRWQAASLKSVREVSARWLLSGDERQLPRAVDSLGKRACVGLFAAARALGLGHVQGVPVHIYVNELRVDGLRRAGLLKAGPADRVDVVLRVPSVRESVFRGAVQVDGLPVCDVLQVWLDVSAHPARGKQQADVIHRRVIKRMVDHANAPSR